MAVLDSFIKGYQDSQSRSDTLKDRALQLKQLQEEKARQAQQDAQRLASQALPIELDEANQVDWWNQTDANPSVRGAKQESINAKRRILGLSDMTLSDVRPNEFSKDMLEAQKLVRSGVHPNLVIKQLSAKYGDWLNTQSVMMENSARLNSKDETISLSNPFVKPKEVAVTNPVFKTDGDVRKAMLDAYNTGGMEAVNALANQYKSAPSTEGIAGLRTPSASGDISGALGNIPNPNPMAMPTDSSKPEASPVMFSAKEIDDALSDMKRYDLENTAASLEKKKYADDLLKYTEGVKSLSQGSTQFVGEKFLHATLWPDWDNSKDEANKKAWVEEGQRLDQDSLQVDINAHVEKGFANGWYPAGVTREDAFKTGRQAALDKNLDLRKAKMYSDDVQRRYNGPNGLVKLSEKYTNQAQFDADTRNERYDMWRTASEADVAAGRTSQPWQEDLYSVKVGMNVKDSVSANQGQQKINETITNNDVKHQEFIMKLETATALAVARLNKVGSGGGSRGGSGGGSGSKSNTVGGLVYTKTAINTKSGMRDQSFLSWMDSIGINRDAAKAGVVDHGSPTARIPELDKLITETRNADKFEYRHKVISLTQAADSDPLFFSKNPNPELKARYDIIKRNKQIINSTWSKATSAAPSLSSSVFIDFRKTGTGNRPVVKTVIPEDPKVAEKRALEKRITDWMTGGGKGAKPKQIPTGGTPMKAKMGGASYSGNVTRRSN